MSVFFRDLCPTDPHEEPGDSAQLHCPLVFTESMTVSKKGLVNKETVVRNKHRLDKYI